jgi:hypothetical protein
MDGPSRCVSNIREKPISASESVILTFASRSVSERSNAAWG